MKNVGLKLIPLTAFCFLGTYTQASDWKKKIEKDGITVYERPASEGSVKETLTQMEVMASPETIIKVMRDIYEYKNWVPNCQSSTLIRKVNDNEFYYYQVYRAPVVKDRDLCAKAIIKKSADGYVLQVMSAPNEIPADKDRVRITNFRSRMEITRTSAGKVSVKQIIYVDPGGNIPAFLTNTSVADAPFDTFKGLRDHVALLLAKN